MRTLARSGATDIDLLLGFKDEVGIIDSSVAKPSSDYSVTCYTSLAAVESLWREFEQKASGSVYQRFDWCKVAMETLHNEPDTTPLILVLKISGRPAVLLPLVRSTNRMGVKKAEFIGESHANVRVPLITDDHINRSRLIRDSQRGIPLQCISEALVAEAELDHLSLTNMPKELDGDINVLVSGDLAPTVIPLFSGALKNDFAELRNERRSTKAQRNARRNLRRVQDQGETLFQRVETDAELDSVIDTFFDQKRARLEEEGGYSSFDVEKNRTFLRALAHRSLQENTRTFELYTLTVDGTPVAIAGGGVHGDRFSMGINSMTNEQVIASQGPGRLSVDMSVESFCGEGLGLFDLGLGEYPYKTMWCDMVETYDVHVPLSAAGHLFNAYIVTRDRLVDQIRRSEGLLKFAKGVRHRLRTGG